MPLALQDVVTAFNSYNVGQVRVLGRAKWWDPAGRMQCTAGSVRSEACECERFKLCLHHSRQVQVFLLSTTAGGAGLNLVGANRLVGWKGLSGR